MPQTNNEALCALALEGLKDVIDPEIGLNVVDLGLIYELHCNDAEKTVACTMTLTTEFCPMGESMVGGVRESLQGTFPEYLIDVKLSFQPPWNYDRISESGREFLNM